MPAPTILDGQGNHQHCPIQVEIEARTR
jgi:hypothetical protein